MRSDLVVVTEKGSQSSFKYSFSFLPAEQRAALNTIYEFCRITDDIVDNEKDLNNKSILLRRWRLELEKAMNQESNYQLLNQLILIAKKFNIPIQHFYELISGVEMDLNKDRYETFNELHRYCYLVASSVGLMSIKIFGVDNERVIKYAENLGIALQLTNILRDIKLDALCNRIYLPKEDMDKFNYSEKELLASKYNSNFVKLMEFEISRAEEYFRLAQGSIDHEDKKYLFAPKIMERIYYHTLLRIKANKYDVFSKHLKLPRFLQLMIALKYLVKHRLFKIV